MIGTLTHAVAIVTSVLVFWGGCTEREGMMRGELSSADPWVRETGLARLNVGDDAWVVTVIDMLERDPDAGVRASSAAALGRIGDRRATPLLVHAAAHDTDIYVRHRACLSLGELRDEGAIAPLITLWRRFGNGDPTSLAVSEALSTIGAPAVSALVVALDDGDWFVRWQAVGTLGRIADAKTEPVRAAISKRLDDEHAMVRDEARSALEKLW